MRPELQIRNFWWLVQGGRVGCPVAATALVSKGCSPLLFFFTQKNVGKVHFWGIDQLCIGTHCTRTHLRRTEVWLRFTAAILPANYAVHTGLDMLTLSGQ